jgi:superfamily II DNA/RNA helicase
MDQRARMASLEAFKNGDVALIVCSDVAARGLDIPDVSHVFNFDVPTHAEDYVHRIGRTGRAGRSGTAYSIVTRADMRYIEDIEKLIARKIDWVGPTLSELPPAEAGEEEERPHGRGRRERGGERSGRGREPRAARPPREHVSQPVVEESVVAEAPAPRREREPRPEPAHRTETRPEPRARDNRRPETRPERRPRRQDDDDAPVVGLGDHVPSFLLRPVVLKPIKVAAEVEATED